LRLKRTIVALGAAAVALVLSGCSNDPYPPEDGKKIIYAVLGEDPHGLDPVRAGDTLSSGIVSQIYESLYEYHYLKRPYELKPCLAASMPRVSADGLTYTIPIKKGVYFQDDPCFVATGGKGRELTAQDFVYSIKRLADQANDPRGWWLLKGKIVGLDEFHEISVERAAGGEKMDYEMPVEGLEAVDRYTLRIRLTEPFPQLKYALQMSYTAAVPREAVEYYGEDFVNHPVGTGPFRLKEWHKRWRLILERNPTYRDDFYPGEGEPGDAESGLLDDAGKKLPIVDEVYYTIVREAQPAWLLFKQGYRDVSGISKDNFNEAITQKRELTDAFREKGVRLTRTPEMVIYYVAFNMKDELVGRNKKLRQAMSLAYDTDWRIEHFHNGRAINAQGPIPPGIFGYDPDFRNPYKHYDLDAARQKLAEAGYPNGIGPDGKQLEITFDVGQATPALRQSALAFANDMAKIGIKVRVVTNTWAEFLNKLHEGRLQVFQVGWLLDYPDPENFLQLLYGPNKVPAGPNASSYDNPEYNRLFERMKAMEDSPERLAIIRRMVDIVVEDCPWIPSIYPVAYTLQHQWVRNYKPFAMTGPVLKYRDVDVALRRRLRREWNRPNYGAMAIMAGVAGVLAFGLAAVRRHPPAQRRAPA